MKKKDKSTVFQGMTIPSNAWLTVCAHLQITFEKGSMSLNNLKRVNTLPTLTRYSNATERAFILGLPAVF